MTAASLMAKNNTTSLESVAHFYPISWMLMMPQNIEILTFEISGMTDFVDNKDLQRREPVTISDSPQVFSHEEDQQIHGKEYAPKKIEEIVYSLNSKSINYSREIESQIRKSLPPHPNLSFQVEVRFHTGSIMMTGTVVAICWVGNIILGEVREQLADVIKLATKRVIDNHLSNSFEHLKPMDMGVKPAQTNDEKADADEPSSTVLPPNQLTSHVPNRETPSWLVSLVLILTLLVAFLMLDRFFDIKLKDDVVETLEGQQETSK